MSNASSDSAKASGFPEHGPNVNWGVKSSIIVSMLALVGAQVVATLALIGLKGGDFDLAESWLSTTPGQFIFVLISDALIVLAIWLFLRSKRAGLRQAGFTRPPALKNDVGRALVAYGVYFGLLIMVVLVVSNLTSIDLDQKQELGFDDMRGNAHILMGMVSLVLLPPIVEEFLFRGFVFTGLRKKMTFLWATVITSALFAAPHLLASSNGLLWIAGVDTLLLSFVLCYLREKTGALWAPMILHGLKNAVAFTILLQG